MTHKAIHVQTGRLVTPEQFISLEGPGYRERGVLPRCPQCDAPLFPYGVHSLKVTSRFDHTDGSHCPLSSTPDSRYAHLAPTEGLTLTWLPYVLVTLTDLSAVEDYRPDPLRLVLHKPARTTLDTLWLRPGVCMLHRYYADTGRAMIRPPIRIPYPRAKTAQGDTAWIRQALLAIIEKCCLSH